MEDISLHILDIVENSIRAKASIIEVIVEEKPEEDILSVTVRDNGKGMERFDARRVLDPFYTTKPEKRIGLGISLFAQAARESGGRLSVKSSPGQGTEVSAIFGLTHPDRKPLGNIEETISLLKAAHPEIMFRYTYRKAEGSYEIKTR
ncbi:MAG: ATP-binding protein [Spirochaetota bacterium]